MTDAAKLYELGIPSETEPNSYWIVFRSLSGWDILESDHKRRGRGQCGGLLFIASLYLLLRLLPPSHSIRSSWNAERPRVLPRHEGDGNLHARVVVVVCPLPSPPSLDLDIILLRRCKDIASILHTPCWGCWTELRAPPLPCPPDIVLLLGKRCQRGLSSFSLFHNLPKGETERREVGTPDTLDTRNSPSLPIALPPLFHAVSLCHWHIVRRPGRNEEASAARLSPPSL